MSGPVHDSSLPVQEGAGQRLSGEGLVVEIAYRAGSLALELAFTLRSRRCTLVGPSGAGKSTLLRLLAGLERPQGGSIQLDGRSLVSQTSGVHVQAGQRRIGYVTQDPSLFPHLNVMQNLAFGLHQLPPAERRARVAQMLTLMQLEPLAERLPARLSGGERQRVALARALAPEPQLLLLDEPFAALDGALKESLLAALDSYLAPRRTRVLAVSHDIAEVFATAEEVLVLTGGRITAQGPPATVLAEERERLLRQLAQ